jgi:hypothetical protein
MGANAVTTVPVYVAGEILTAADLNITNSGIPVFASTTTRDAAFGGAGEKTLAQGQFCYLESTGKLQVYTGSAWSNVGTSTNVATFTASGTWTVPTGVTYAIAYIRGGGGGVGTVSAGAGGTSSVAFAGGTISALGGVAINHGVNVGVVTAAGQANSGNGALIINDIAGATPKVAIAGGVQNGVLITAGGAVTAGASVTITVGSGGTAGTGGSAGGTGYIFITYEV